MNRELTDKVRHAFVTDKRDSCRESELPDAGKKEEEVNRNVAAKPECLTHNQVPKELLKLAKAEFIQTYRSRNHFRDLLLVQVKLSGLKMWLFEMLAAAAICICMQETFRDPYFMTFRKQLFLLTCFAVSVPLLMLPFLYRSIRYQMFEVECASVFSIRTVLFSKFLVFFGGEVGMTAALTGFLRWKGNFSWTEIAVCVLIPVLLVNDGVLVLLKRAKPEKMCRDMLDFGGILLAAVSLILLLEQAGIVKMGHFPTALAVGLAGLLVCYGIFEGAGFLRMAEA